MEVATPAAELLYLASDLKGTNPEAAQILWDAARDLLYCPEIPWPAGNGRHVGPELSLSVTH
jgi:hypothetical protein